MNELSNIENMIYQVRGRNVMFDFDLATLYEVETRRLKEQVKRNIERFPADFMFQLTKIEWRELIAICDKLPESIKHSPVAPSVFTQEGVAMLSGVLRSQVAITQNIKIMRAFVAMRNFLSSLPVNEVKELQKEVRELKQHLEDVFTDYNDINEDTRIQLELINQSLAELQAKNKALNKPHNPVGYHVIEERRKNKSE